MIQTTTDGEEGRKAFNEKRKPNFDGRLRQRGEAWPELSEEDFQNLLLERLDLCHNRNY